MEVSTWLEHYLRSRVYTCNRCNCYHTYNCSVPGLSRVFANAEFSNLNFTKKIRILFVESEVEVDLRKRNRFSTKYLTGRKKRGWG